MSTPVKKQSEPPLKKQPKMQDFICKECGRRYSSNTALRAHEKNKHRPVEQKKVSVVATELEKVKVEPLQEKKVKEPLNSKPPKSKNFEQYQQDLQDKIYAYLGELGQKHYLHKELGANDDKGNQSNMGTDEADRMMGQANYLQNNIIRTPFQVEFDVAQELKELDISDQDAKEHFQVFNNQMIILNDKLNLEKDRWEFRDPIDTKNLEEEEFSLINILSVLRNYKKKQIVLQFPEYSVFVLWLARICKPVAWRDFLLIVGHLIIQFEIYRNQNFLFNEKNQSSWKKYFNEYIEKLENDIGKPLTNDLKIVQKEDIISFARLYFKWVMYFDLF